MPALQLNNTEWFSLDVKYNSPRICVSHPQSIRDNFRFRILSQTRGNAEYPFPIKLISTLIKRAATLQYISGNYGINDSLLKRASLLEQEFDWAVDNLIDRISFNAPNKDNKSIWKYPLAMIRKLGFKNNDGSLQIMLSGKNSAPFDVYSLSPERKKYEKLIGVHTLQQLHLDHSPRMEDILYNCQKSLESLKIFDQEKIHSDKLRHKNFHENHLMWQRLLELLPDIISETKIIFAQTNLSLSLAQHNLKKG